MESTNRLRYLIAGTGGVGGSIAGFLSLAGKDVTCIARGAHLQAIQQDGLKLKSDLKGEHALRINTCTAEEYNGKADVSLPRLVQTYLINRGHHALHQPHSECNAAGEHSSEG